MFKKTLLASAVQPSKGCVGVVSKSIAFPLVLLSAASSAFAAEGTAAWDYSSLTSSVDFSSIGTGVLSVAAAMAVVYAGIKGAQIVLGFLRR